MSKKRIKRLDILLIIFLSLAFAIGFYIDGRSANINDTSSDQWNIIPVCIKLDHPDLYKGDLFADNINDIKYYTPFFITGVRLFTRISDDDYLEGLNKFNFTINFTYTFLWALLFYFIGRNIQLALLMSIIVRGILWLPGFELWGAGALWTALPRTAFLALIPLPLILFLPELSSKKRRYLGAFFCGIISNFHPISGLGLCITLLISDFLYRLFYIKEYKKELLKESFLISVFMLIGLSPYLYVYFTDVISNNLYDHALFNNLITLRIGNQFREPLLALKKFGQIRWIIFLITPLLVLSLVLKKADNKLKNIGIFYLIFIIVLLVTSLLTVPFESSLRYFGLDFHMAFQLIRNVKYVMISIFIFYFLVLLYLTSRVSTNKSKIASTALLIVLFFTLLISRLYPFNRLPFIGDDLIRSTLPNIFSLKDEKYFTDNELLQVFAWIESGTTENSKFIGPPSIRAACRKSVVFDTKGASMLIEGNKGKFIEWGEKLISLKKAQIPESQIKLYKNWGADWVITRDTTFKEIKKPTKRFGTWMVFRLDE